MLVNVFVQDLAAANAGFIVGEFIALPCEEREIENHIKMILDRGQENCRDNIHEEWFIADTEWRDDIVEIFQISEFENIFALNKKLIQIEENVEPYQYGILKVLIENGFASSIEDAIEKIDNVIVHSNCNMSDIAYSYIEENFDVSNIPPIILGHIDYDSMGRNIEIDGNFIRENLDIFEIIE